MTYLFSKSGMRQLRSFMEGDPLYAFDFDGTIAPISARPGGVRVPASVRKNLELLTKSHHLAVISGRSISDLKAILRLKDCYLVGNHGLEGFTSCRRRASRFRRICVSWRTQLMESPSSDVFGKLAQLEDKTYSLAFHYRAAKNRSAVRAALLRIIDSLHPAPRVIAGKCVLNIVPEGARHKGTALTDMMTKLGVGNAIYVGDDYTDEDVFALAASNIMTIRVGMSRSSKADYFLKRQSEIDELLSVIAQKGGR